MYSRHRAFEENLVGLGLLVVYFLYEINPDPRRKKMLWEKVVQLFVTFNLIFLGLGWPWVGEFVGFVVIFMFLNPTELGKSHNIVRNGSQSGYE